MAKRMLIDSTHAEETRVVVLDGNRIEDFDVETSTKRQLKGNIYLAKVVRVEPSLQAAFVEYGGNRHGFLAFGEIHPDYYQIPVADRQRLVAQQLEEARREQEAEDRADAREPLPGTSAQPEIVHLDAPQPEPFDAATVESEPPPAEAGSGFVGEATGEIETRYDDAVQVVTIEHETIREDVTEEPRPYEDESPSAASDRDAEVEAAAAGEVATDLSFAETPAVESQPQAAGDEVSDAEEGRGSIEMHGQPAADQPPPETVGGDADAAEDVRERRIPSRFLRNYKIQEVIRRRQILLIQVVKEERGSKGAALTTYLSLAGRYCVLMPNSPSGGGISRKITSAADRRRLKEITTELDIPGGMGLIVRTAGANRPKPEIKRDCEYLLRLWDDIRDHTLKSVAPALIYEEASLIKRAIRDVYSRDIDEIVVDGEDGWKAARDFMRMLMPAHARKVQLWRDPATAGTGTGAGMPLFARNQVDAQLDAFMMPTVQLRSGGYLVINQTEALVAIDVNSGRSTRERGIEETALRTNMEAAEEAARQLRLRDLAGLIVIDFIDMESRKHNAMVERKLKDALKNDRARIQVGHISHFGLMEMSRQRLRPSVGETSFVTCMHCAGTGTVRSTESAAIHVLRHVEEEGAKGRAAEIVVHVAGPVAMYILNNKRDRLASIEARYAMRVLFEGDPSLIAPEIRIDRTKAQIAGEIPVTAPLPAPAMISPAIEADDIAEDEDVVDAEDEAEPAVAAAPANGAEAKPAVAETAEEGERRRRRRRRRRRNGRRDDAVSPDAAVAGTDSAGGDDTGADDSTDAPFADADEEPAQLFDPEEAQPALSFAEALEGVPELSESMTTEAAPAEADAPAPEPAAPEPVEATAQAPESTESLPAEPVAVEATAPAAPAEEDAAPRRRTRRVGVRRRRTEPADGTLPAVAEPGAEQPDVPRYTGPTPADPFGTPAFDIFETIEREQEQRAAAPARRRAPARSRAAAAAAREAAANDTPKSDTPAADGPPSEVPGSDAPVASAEMPSLPLPEPLPEVTTSSSDVPLELAVEQTGVSETSREDDAPPQPANDAAPEPVIKPILVGGTDAPAAEKKRGWWRR